MYYLKDEFRGKKMLPRGVFFHIIFGGGIDLIDRSILIDRVNQSNFLIIIFRSILMIKLINRIP